LVTLFEALITLGRRKVVSGFHTRGAVEQRGVFSNINFP
jgi:hypothetical protein